MQESQIDKETASKNSAYLSTKVIDTSSIIKARYGYRAWQMHIEAKDKCNEKHADDFIMLYFTVQASKSPYRTIA